MRAGVTSTTASGSRGTARTVLVAGGTGRFGAVVDMLLSRGHHVRAATRNVGGAPAARLRRLGAEPVHADFDDRQSLLLAARGMDAVFASGTAHHAGPQGEVRHGRNLADAVAAAGVRHLVFVSGAGSDTASGVPVLESKGQVERHIRALDVPHTLIAPVYLMENLFNPWNVAPLLSGKLPTPVPPSLRLQQAAVADILAIAVRAIERREELLGERLAVASDESTGSDDAAALSAVIGRSLEAEALGREALAPGLRALFEWLDANPVGVDIPTLHARFAEIRWHRFETWAREHGQRLRALGGRLAEDRLRLL